MKKYDNKTIEKLMFRYFNIRNFEISKFQSFYISSFKILTPTLLKISVMKTIGDATSVTDNRRVTKVFGVVNKKMIGRGKQKIGRRNRRNKTKCILNSSNDL